MRRVACLGLVAGVLAGCVPLFVRAPRDGGPAPPTRGVDGAGQPLDLETFRGKVVLLSFWHSQCPPCRALFRHERALVERYAGKPFALLGVNADAEAEQLQRTQQQAGLTWPSWWDGPAGKISTAWKVDRFPTLVLIDAQGVVRWRHVGIPAEGVLEAKIEEHLPAG